MDDVPESPLVGTSSHLPPGVMVSGSDTVRSDPLTMQLGQEYVLVAVTVTSHATAHLL